MAGAPAARMALPSRRLPALRGSPAGSPASPSSCATPPGRSLPPPPPTPRLGHTAPQVRRRGRLGPQSGAAPGGGPGGSSRGPRGAEGSAGAVRRGKGGAEPSRAQLRGARGAEPQRERSAALRQCAGRRRAGLRAALLSCELGLLKGDLGKDLLKALPRLGVTSLCLHYILATPDFIWKLPERGTHRLSAQHKVHQRC